MAGKRKDPIERVLGPKAVPIRKMLDTTGGDLGRYVRDFAYRERAGKGAMLEPRELMAITALSMLNLKPQLKTHVYGALHVGLSRREIEEAFIHLSLYAGFPVALSGLHTAKEVFAEIDAAGPEKRRGASKKV